MVVEALALWTEGVPEASGITLWVVFMSCAGLLALYVGAND